MPPLLIYVAGPYRAPTTWGINCNIHKARLWGAELAKLGVYPVIPHSNTSHFDGIAEDKLWLDGTMQLLHRCDAAIFIEGWKDSSGARAEMERALSIQMMPVFDVENPSHPSLKDWVSSIVNIELHDTENIW